MIIIYCCAQALCEPLVKAMRDDTGCSGACIVNQVGGEPGSGAMDDGLENEMQQGGGNGAEEQCRKMCGKPDLADRRLFNSVHQPLRRDMQSSMADVVPDDEGANPLGMNTGRENFVG